MLPSGVNERILSLQWEGDLLQSCNVLPLFMSWWSFLRPMDLGNDGVEWFLHPLAPLLDREVARGNCDHPSHNATHIEQENKPYIANVLKVWPK